MYIVVDCTKNVFFLLVKVLEVAYYLCLVEKIFRQDFLCFSKRLLGCKIFHLFGFHMGVVGQKLISSFHVKAFFIVFAVRHVAEDVDGSDRVSGKNNEVFEEIFMCLFTKMGSR